MRLLIYLTITSLILTASCSRKPEYPGVSAAEDIAIDEQSLKQGIPVFRSFASEKGSIDFFVIRTSKGVESYFDACKKCWPKKLGFRYEEGRMVCRACQEGYPVDRLDGIGSCYPVRLLGKLEAGKYIIRKEAILNGAGFF